MKFVPVLRIQPNKVTERSNIGIIPPLGLVNLKLPKDSAKQWAKWVTLLRPRSRMAELVCLSDRRKKFIQEVNELEAIFQAS